MNKVFVLLALVFVLGSCSSIKTIHSIELPRNSNNKIQQDHVDLIINDRVEKTIDIIPTEETVRVGDKGGDIFNGSQGESVPRLDEKKIRI